MLDSTKIAYILGSSFKLDTVDSCENELLLTRLVYIKIIIIIHRFLSQKAKKKKYLHNNNYIIQTTCALTNLFKLTQPIFEPNYKIIQIRNDK